MISFMDYFDIIRTNFKYGKILNKFVFQHKRALVKFTVAVRNFFSLFWPSHL